ncbi:unnamed protein product [Alternaria alternata]
MDSVTLSPPAQAVDTTIVSMVETTTTINEQGTIVFTHTTTDQPGTTALTPFRFMDLPAEIRVMTTTLPKNEEAFHGLQTIPSSITGSLLAG